ncbi:cobalamin-dependent protein [Desulfococcus multivorans]|nr:cobalamin-dependent protein [Desulfococcus multivorans]
MSRDTREGPYPEHPLPFSRAVYRGNLMIQTGADLRKRISEMVETLRKTRRPSRNALLSAAQSVLDWKQEHGAAGLWDPPPLMVTATMDDGWGHGLEVIHRYGEVAGLSIVRLGLLRTADEIIRACTDLRPDILGLTVLQFDTVDTLAEIRRRIPGETRIVAGGPIFGADPDLAPGAGIDFVATDAVAFIEYLLRFQPARPSWTN